MRDDTEILEEICGKLGGCDGKDYPQLAISEQYDFVNIVDVEDERMVNRLSLELSSRGDVETVVIPALPLGGVPERGKEDGRSGSRVKRRLSARSSKAS